MTVFWLLAGAMVVSALAFITLPLLRSNRHHSDIDRDQLNTAVIREQLSELKADLTAGKLDASAFESARHDLERELLSALSGDGHEPRGRSHNGRWLLALLLPGIPLLAVLLYLQLGADNFSERASQPRSVEAENAGNMSEHDINRALEQLAQRLREEPDNPDGWILLGRTYTSLQRFDDAVTAYQQARKYGGDTPELLVDYADTLASASGGNFSDETGALLQQALALQPDNPKGLWLMGHWHYQRGNYQQAIENWRRVAAQVQPGSENDRVLQQQMQMAQSKLTDTAAVKTDAGTNRAETNHTGGASIRVTVSLDPALRGNTAPDDTVFIFARAVDGPRMPLAIVRKQVRDLPVTVTLNDAMAMSPAAALSQFPQVTVGARISKTGQAMPAAGDLQGMQSPVSTKDTSGKVDIVIDERVGG